MSTGDQDYSTGVRTGGVTVCAKCGCSTYWNEHDPGCRNCAELAALRKRVEEAEGELKELGLDGIVSERKRQVSKEKWTPEHDDGHINGELAMAGACYALPKGAAFVAFNGPNNSPRTFDPWPWFTEYCRYSDGPAAVAPAWDKRDKHDRLRSLNIAGALIAAEIARMRRRRDEAMKG